MPADTFADFYRRYVEQCQRVGVEPVMPERAAEFLASMGALSPIPTALLIPPAEGVTDAKRG